MSSAAALRELYSSSEIVTDFGIEFLSYLLCAATLNPVSNAVKSKPKLPSTTMKVT